MKRVLFTIIGLGLLIVLSGCRTVVPNVKGMTITQATKAIKHDRFRVGRVVYNEKAHGTTGTVISQVPGADERAKDGLRIRLTISGPPPVVTPDVNGIAFPDSIIRNAGLSPKEIPIHGPIEPDAGDYMEAYRQNPRAGTLVPKGSTVTYHFWWEAED